ncbi:hypothetical protein BKA65DRAFT_59232 [Rhexocercosporidium sp. MPI-PUGE-AT-0058]|nr:hypothetical protein BKA65DRAFT_59232 [Rhexocercosporidium sp. MPI-PUGE-AT-0058]
MSTDDDKAEASLLPESPLARWWQDSWTLDKIIWYNKIKLLWDTAYGQVLSSENKLMPGFEDDSGYGTRSSIGIGNFPKDRTNRQAYEPSGSTTQNSMGISSDSGYGTRSYNGNMPGTVTEQQNYPAFTNPWSQWHQPNYGHPQSPYAKDVARVSKHLPSIHAYQAPTAWSVRQNATVSGTALHDPPQHPSVSPSPSDDLACHACSSSQGSTHYHCSTCPGTGYTVCLSCADEGLSCPSAEHMLMKRTWDKKKGSFANDKLHTISRGLRVLINGQLVPGIGDTGSEETIVSATRCREMGWTIQPSKKIMRLGNQGIMTSIGTVRIMVSFPDRPTEMVQVLAHVVKNFCFDILLGRPFLKATQTMEKYIHRFKRCFFPARNLWAFYRIGETTQRFHGMMANGNQVPFAALPDTGSRRNVMSAEWALQQGLHIQTERENLGWITFPAGPDEATVGQVHTQILLPGGKLVPIVFDVLPTSRLPVVLGIDFVLDNNIYQDYAGSFSEAEGADGKETSECMGMGYKPWYAISVEKLVRKAKSLMGHTASLESTSSLVGSRQHVSVDSTSPVNFVSATETQELKRQRKWDERYGAGRLASVEEWDEEMQRRLVHEGTTYLEVGDGHQVSLIAHAPAAKQSGSAASTESNDAILRLSFLNRAIRMDDYGDATAAGPQHSTTPHEGVEEKELHVERSGQGMESSTLFGELEAVHWRA